MAELVHLYSDGDVPVTLYIFIQLFIHSAYKEHVKHAFVTQDLFCSESSQLESHDTTHGQKPQQDKEKRKNQMIY